MTGTPALEKQLCFALYAASRAMTNAYRPSLAKLGLTYPQFVTLLVLWEHDGMCVADLATRLYLDASTLSPLLKRLQAMGLIERRRCSSDERRVTIHLTDDGFALAGPATQAQRDVACKLNLNDEEAATLRSLTGRLLQAYGPTTTE
ncbi:MarR family winged helix-turn-helix transcriptional regulator [Gephyromycinifex aptenodytis]|uniref:MarR family winged helix-turn-helix transcriptional regulator n=1 Tax=Gephyromycinifex aptenodytis TaxID=2716227 RepID=UPI001D01AAEB|nr:MarR family transcriptional regulator [Gephyromycinifex aptenodytis]